MVFATGLMTMGGINLNKIRMCCTLNVKRNVRQEVCFARALIYIEKACIT